MDYDKKPESDDSKDKSESFKSEPKSEPKSKPKVVAAPEYVRGPGGKLTLKSKS